ncbi:MAG: hypothetical protein COU90_01340 [Candidatus Ryanbacteria bacterium CG10_big_fil_rev_8_21_14_0_10_43_42]|uniref:Type 4a pilus biogenesis protein PilO n=1 Tax=Candidatus Ryanbacteria bacterium CG10_big_fil_rev_8_21_14_0_10_43_42 TaxID=1974864 RepID=A0A2M8KXS6_9BACT|nr:MAG: hypothetical protein COU90_01340 [Candidatus Ryanbacteria bacterium CG10_big_fil_rev_8_21_14_0_10_43_42]
MKKHKLILTVIFGILGNALLVLLAYLFIFQAIQNSYTSLLASHEQFAVLKKKERLLKELEATVISKQSDINRINNAFLRSTDIVTFVETLERIAVISGADLTINSASTSLNDEEKIQHSVFDLFLDGTFPEIYQYITLLENIPFHARILTATINQNGHTGPIRSTVTVDVLTLK